jgi:K+-transporting ATPase ATPase C chain
MRRQLLTGLLMTITMIVLVGLVYPFAMTGAAQVLFHDRANGSLVKVDGKVVGSSLIGQNFVLQDGSPDPKYFQPRPSAAGDGYDAMSSGGTNDGPSSQTLLDDVSRRVKDYRTFNGLPARTEVPVDAVTASASGLDPDISVANARLQAARVAKTRNLSVDQVLDLVEQHTDDRPLGFLGEETVNVLDLNLALDQLQTK